MAGMSLNEKVWFHILHWEILIEVNGYKLASHRKQQKLKDKKDNIGILENMPVGAYPRKSLLEVTGQKINFALKNSWIFFHQCKPFSYK